MIFALASNEWLLGVSPVSVWNGTALTPIRALEGIRAFDMATTASGALVVAGDYGLNTPETPGVLMLFQENTPHILIERDTTFFNSVFVSGNQMVALDTSHIWWGAI